MSYTLIKVESLVKKFQDISVLDNLKFSVSSGEVFGFLGPNGAGKTTTIKILSGILKPTSGKVFIDGMDMEKYPIECKKITSLVPEQPHLWEHLSGYEYLVFVGNLYGIGKESLKERIPVFLEKFGLVASADKMIETYSYGMKQKLIWCAALLTEPKIMLLDEPFIGLDPHSVKTAKMCIEEAASRGAAVFISTHILEIAEKLCGKICVIDKGKIVAIENQKDLKKIFSGNLSLEEIFFELTKEKQPGI